MDESKLQEKLTNILKANNIENIELALDSLMMPDVETLEMAIEQCNKAILGIPFENPDDRFLYVSIPDAETEICGNEVDIWNLLFENQDCTVPLKLFRNLLEIVHSFHFFHNGRFFHNGNVSREGEYLNGKREGEWIKYFESGQIQTIGSYKEGKLIGEWKRYYENGQLQQVKNYDYQDYRSWISWEWYENGQLKSEWNSFETKGEIIEWIEFRKTSNGYKESKIRFELTNSDLVIDYKGYHEDGKIKQRRLINHKGKIADGKRNFYQNNRMKVYTIFKNGEAIERKNFD